MTNLFWYLEHCNVLLLLVCAGKVFEYAGLCNCEWVLQRLNWINVMRGSLCFKDSLSWVSSWHDEVADCHSCLTKPTKGVWLNSHSFRKVKWSHLETYKPYGQVNKMSLKQILLVLSEENDNRNWMPLCAAHGHYVFFFYRFHVVYQQFYRNFQ